jgi:hypothetical protein
MASFSVPGNCFYVVDNSGTLSPAATASTPYVGAKDVTTTRQTMSGAIGLPTVEGTSYVTVSGDPDKSDCNAFTPKASGSGITAVYQANGFPQS